MLKSTVASNLTLDFAAVRENLFPASHGAMGDWLAFPWHRDRTSRIQARGTSAACMPRDVPTTSAGNNNPLGQVFSTDPRFIYGNRGYG